MEHDLKDFYPLVRAMARRYQGPGLEQEDLEQEAWLALLEARRDYCPGIGTPRPAYYRLRLRGALCQVMRRYQRDALSQASDRDIPLSSLSQDSPEPWQLLSLLPRRQKQVLELSLRQGLSLLGVAQVLGITPAAVYTHFQRGTRRLARALSGKNFLRDADR